MMPAGFHDGNDADGAGSKIVGGLRPGDQAVDPPQILGRLDFGQDDRVEIGANHGFHVSGREAGVEGVYPDRAKDAAQRRQRLAGGFSGADFLAKGDGILEVEDNGVGTGRREVADFPRLVGRTE